MEFVSLRFTTTPSFKVSSLTLISKIVRKEVVTGNSSGRVLIKSVSSNFCVCGKFPAKADGNMLKDWPSFLGRGVVILQKLKP